MRISAASTDRLLIGHQAENHGGRTKIKKPLCAIIDDPINDLINDPKNISSKGDTYEGKK